MNSSSVIKPGRVTVQRSFIVINKPFAYAGGVLFENIKGCYLYPYLYPCIGARVFVAGISLPVRLDQELQKVL